MNLNNTSDSSYTRFCCPRFRISAVLFRYHEHQYPIRGQILKLITCVETFPGLSGNVMQIISWHQFNIKMTIVMRFPFYAFRYIHRNATPVYNESRLYLMRCPLSYHIVVGHQKLSEQM
jgi:hypothetical protein